MIMRANNWAFILSRSIYDSEIWSKPSDWLKIWIYLLWSVNFVENNLFKRWEDLFKYETIARANGVSYKTVEKCMKYLRERNQIGITRTSRGAIISIKNYDKYQDLSNYGESKENQKRIKRESSSDSISKEWKKERKKEDTIVSTEIVKADNRNQDIQKLIYHIKEFCSSRSIIYDSTDERNFAKHIVSAKEFGELSKAMGKERIDLALSIIELAEMDKFWRGKACWPKSIYQNRAKILNNGRATYINQNSNPDVLVI